jgi:ubiquinone/menaquinone biosynthesis C-methylase UbiE
MVSSHEHVGGLHREFQQPTESVDSKSAFAWLDRADASPLIQAIKQRMLELCPISPGAQVLDVGCGLGHELQRLAQQVGPSGRVVGIDVSSAMVGEARRRTAELEVPIMVEVGDAHALAFPDEHFDVCRVERVLRYLDRPESALREMVRVVRRDGFVVAFDFDSDQTVIDAPDPELTRRIANVLDAAVPHPWIGRQLHGLFRRIGLTDVRVIPHALCLTGAQGLAMYKQLNEGTIAAAMDAGRVTAADAATWWDALEQAGRDETFLVANLGFVVVGRKCPASIAEAPA